MKDNPLSEEILSGIALQFCPPSTEEVEVRALGSGNINDTFLLSPIGGKREIVLQKINQSVFRQPLEVVLNSIKLFEHLSKKHLPLQLLEPVPTREGKSYTLDSSGDYWRAYWFIPEAKTYDYATSPLLAFQAAKAMALFLSGLSDLDPKEIYPVIPRFHDGLWRMEQFQEAVLKDEANRVRETGEEIAFALREQDIFRQVAEAGFPQRVVHNDAKMGNMLFDRQEERVLAVIDWDTTMPGAIASDFGDMVRTMATTLPEDDARFEQVVLRLEWFEALVRGFVPPLKEALLREELLHLVSGAKWIILEQMIRFLGDYLNGDRYYKTRYAGHNLVRARNQMALYASLLKQEKAMQGLVKQVLG